VGALAVSGLGLLHALLLEPLLLLGLLFFGEVLVVLDLVPGSFAPAPDLLASWVRLLTEVLLLEGSFWARLAVCGLSLLLTDNLEFGFLLGFLFLGQVLVGLDLLESGVASIGDLLANLLIIIIMGMRMRVGLAMGSLSPLPASLPKLMELLSFLLLGEVFVMFNLFEGFMATIIYFLTNLLVIILKMRMRVWMGLTMGSLSLLPADLLEIVELLGFLSLGQVLVVCNLLPRGMAEIINLLANLLMIRFFLHEILVGMGAFALHGLGFLHALVPGCLCLLRESLLSELLDKGLAFSPELLTVVTSLEVEGISL